MRNPKNQDDGLPLQTDATKELARIKKKCKCGACEPPKPKLPEGIRRLKVQPKYITDRPSKNPTIPLIILQGEWLRNTGFDCESHVLIEQQPGQLVIRVERS
jgi:hypothetical protein